MAPVMPVVPDHELIRRIGGGSYGDVWLARTTVGTWRAVKVVFRDRFTDARPYEREFHGIQKFEPLSRGNEAFIDILQIGRNDAEGYFYYVMELADDSNAECGVRNAELPLTRPADTLSPTGGEGRGEGAATPQLTSPSSLSDPHSYIPKTLAKVLLQRGRLPVGECLELGLTLNLGLAHLHRAGLIHRDIKPSNIIFVGGVPKLADIGLVIETTEARSYVGTEGFIPPEGPNSPQADLYSLGKVLYEAGMGKDRKDFPEPYTQIAEAPDAAALLEFNAILLKACAANRDERYQSAEEMNADLALLQSGGSVRRQRKLAGQLRFVQRAGALVTALAAVIALGWWWQAKQTRIVRDLAAENSRLLGLEQAAHDQALAAEKAALNDRDRARRSEQNTQRVLQFLLERVVAVARPQAEDGKGLGREVSVLQALQAAESGIPETFAQQPRAELELRESLATTFRQLGLATNEVAHRQRALELSEAEFGSGSPEVLTNRMQLGWALRDSGLTNEYLAQFQTAWLTASNSFGRTDEKTLHALAWMGVAYREVGRRTESVRIGEEAVQTCRQAYGENDPRNLSLMNHLAWSYYLNGQPERAIPLLEQVISGRQRTLGREHADTTGPMIDLGRAYLAVRREREAFTLLEEAYEIRRQAHGHQHAATLIAIDALARSCERAGRTNDALTWHTLALRLREEKLGPEQSLLGGMSSTVRSRNDVLRLRAALGMPTNQPAR